MSDQLEWEEEQPILWPATSLSQLSLSEEPSGLPLLALTESELSLTDPTEDPLRSAWGSPIIESRLRLLDSTHSNLNAKFPFPKKDLKQAKLRGSRSESKKPAQIKKNEPPPVRRLAPKYELPPGLTPLSKRGQPPVPFKSTKSRPKKLEPAKPSQSRPKKREPFPIKFDSSKYDKYYVPMPRKLLGWTLFRDTSLYSLRKP